MNEQNEILHIKMFVLELDLLFLWASRIIYTQKIVIEKVSKHYFILKYHCKYLGTVPSEKYL